LTEPARRGGRGKYRSHWLDRGAVPVSLGDVEGEAVDPEHHHWATGHALPLVPQQPCGLAPEARGIEGCACRRAAPWGGSRCAARGMWFHRRLSGRTCKHLLEPAQQRERDF